MLVTFLVALLGMALLWVTLWKVELTSKNAKEQLKRLRRRLEIEDEAVPAEEAGQSEAAQPAPVPAH